MGCVSNKLLRRFTILHLKKLTPCYNRRLQQEFGNMYTNHFDKKNVHVCGFHTHPQYRSQGEVVYQHRRSCTTVSKTSPINSDDKDEVQKQQRYAETDQYPLWLFLTQFSEKGYRATIHFNQRLKVLHIWVQKARSL